MEVGNEKGAPLRTRDTESKADERSVPLSLGQLLGQAEVRHQGPAGTGGAAQSELLVASMLKLRPRPEHRQRPQAPIGATCPFPAPGSGAAFQPIPRVFVSCVCCCNKSQTQWLNIAQAYYLTVLDVCSLKWVLLD